MQSRLFKVMNIYNFTYLKSDLDIISFTGMLSSREINEKFARQQRYSVNCCHQNQNKTLAMIQTRTWVNPFSSCITLCLFSVPSMQSHILLIPQICHAHTSRGLCFFSPSLGHLECLDVPCLAASYLSLRCYLRKTFPEFLMR